MLLPMEIEVLGGSRGTTADAIPSTLVAVPDMCCSPSWIQKSFGREAFAARRSMHPTELVFLARHVVGQIQPGPGVARCRWVPVATAAQTLPPPAA